VAYTIEFAKACRKHDNINFGQRILIVGEDFNPFDSLALVGNLQPDDSDVALLISRRVTEGAK
jgi:hypothetical protein